LQKKHLSDKEIEIFLTVWFRLVYVIRAFDNMSGHKIPFMGLQIILSMIAIQNPIYYNFLHDDEVNWKRLSFSGNRAAYLSLFGWIYSALLIGT
jgi:hypothetical protein